MQLLSSAPDEKRQEYISALSGKALRLERLIDDFYQISLLEAGQYPFYYGKVELCSLLTEILLDNYSTFSVNGIEPQIEIPDVNIYLNADRKACIRIIQNLIFNAITSTTSNVVVQLIYNTDSVQLCIKILLQLFLQKNIQNCWSAFMWQIFQGVTVHLDRDFIL